MGSVLKMELKEWREKRHLSDDLETALSDARAAAKRVYERGVERRDIYEIDLMKRCLAILETQDETAAAGLPSVNVAAIFPET